MAQYGVIFDMDGVLVDSYRPHYESWRRTAAEFGLEVTLEQFQSTFGRTSPDIIRHLWPGKVKEADVAEWDRRKEASYREILRDHFPEMAGASDLIQRLHDAGFLLAIGSSGPTENIELVRAKLPAGKLISATVTGKEVAHGKPAPDVFLTAAKKLGLPPGHCLVVEDAPAGVEAGNRAGMATIAITGTATRDKLAHASFVVDSLNEVSPDLVRALIEKNN